MRASLLEVLQSAQLWRIWLRLGVQDVRLRFRRSAIGMGWIFLNLVVMILAVGFIYGNIFGQDMQVFIPYLTLSLVTWLYITSSIIDGGNAFLNSEGYIKQIGLPIYVYVFRSFVSVGLVGLINLSVFFVVGLIYSVPFTVDSLWAVPGLLILTLASFLLIAIFAHINARFRDAAHLASMLMQVMMYVTPVIYPADLLRKRGLGIVIDANPFYHLLQVVRDPLLSGKAADSLNYYSDGLVILLLLGIALALIRIYQRRIVFAL
jgi:lipopolysaccharide transport system permease protein